MGALVNLNDMFNNIYFNKKVLITGNTGFKGSWLTTWLLKMNAKVYGISIDVPTKPSMFETLDLENKIVHCKEDLRNLKKIVKIVDDIKPDFVFHLAAQPLVFYSYKEPIETISTNVIGTSNILEALRQSNHNCIGIIITSDKCYNNVEWEWGYKETDELGGKDVYSGSKAAAEMIINSYYHSFFKDLSKFNVKVLSTRAGNVIGGGDWAMHRIVPDCVKAWSRGKTVEIRSPNSTRPWQHVLEPLSGYLAAGQALFENDKLNGESFNFGPKPEYSQTVEELIRDLSKYWNFENYSEAFTTYNNNRYHEAGLLKLNCDKALFHLRWLPTLDYDQLIEFTSVWYYEYYQSKSSDLFEITLNQISQYEENARKKEIKWTK